MDLKSYELLRVLELENSNLKAALTGAADNLRDAEVEIGRLRLEIRILKGMLPKLYPRTYLDSEGNTHRYDEERYDIPILEDGPPPCVYPQRTKLDQRHFAWLAKQRREHEERVDKMQAMIAKAGPGDGSKGDTVKILSLPQLANERLAKAARALKADRIDGFTTDEEQAKFRAADQAQRQRVRDALDGCYDEHGLTEEQKRADFNEHRWITEQDIKE